MRELRLERGDYVPDGAGGLTGDEGARGVLDRVLFRLTARRGSFPFLPELGSRLYLLPREKPSARSTAAREYVAQALEEEREVTLTGVTLSGEELTVELLWQGEGLSLTTRVEGV